MADFTDRNLPHVFLSGVTEGVPYTSLSSGGGTQATFPARDRKAHAERLLSELGILKDGDVIERKNREAEGLPTDYGLVIEFESFPEFSLPADSLDRPSSDIRLLNLRTRLVQNENGESVFQEFATVRIPFGKLSIFERLVTSYRDRDTDQGKPMNQKLISHIESIRRAAIDAFWNDQRPMPAPGQIATWEAWLRASDKNHSREDILAALESAAQNNGIERIGKPISLPETTIVLIRCAREQIEQSIEILDCLTELRAPAVAVAILDDMEPEDQAEWVQHARDRLMPPSPTANALCLLDTGVNHGHPLLKPVIPPDGLHTFKPAWGTDDQHANGDGHGTQMAGLAAYGDLTHPILSSEPVIASHWVESAKIYNDRDKQLQEQWGNVVVDTVGSLEQAAPERPRVFAMQITSLESSFDGRPTSWSSATDKFCAAVGEDPAIPRVLFQSAGNWECTQADNYPEINREWSVHDPGQAWNAITVGAITHKDSIRTPGHEHFLPIARKGALSPVSPTSCVWNPIWPIKPDIVFEGGNKYQDGNRLWKHPDLELLTTNAKFRERLLTTADGTSSASVLAARVGAAIQRQYPSAWPETIRALVVHSAEWTEGMKHGRSLNSKAAVADLLRHYGHGEPDLARALRTARSAVSLVAQDEFQPFKKDAQIKTNEMRFHELPWPKEALEAIGTATVTMRVTLSYFIEPNPGPRLTNDNYRYASCHLRFEVMRPLEKPSEFRARINAADREPGYKSSGGSDSNRWEIGSDFRHRGSLHQDTWIGPAAELASKPCIAVYPVNGWWRLRPFLKRFDSRIRYALVVSIRSEEQPVDLYTPIATQLGIGIPAEISTTP
jgi:hypothetical protein